MKNFIDSFPSLILPDYKPLVLARLLPSRDEIEGMSRAQAIALDKERIRLEHLIDTNPVRFFQPNKGGQFDFMTCDDPHIKAKYFFAGNQTGKTTGSAILAAERATGKTLWGHSFRKVAHRVPTTGFFYCDSFATHKQTIIPTFLSWCPRREVAGVERGPTGSPETIHMRNGTIIYCRTYDQGYLATEGKAYDWGWCDEPPPRDIFTGLWRGLVARNGDMWIAATLLSEEWLYDEMNQPFVRVFDASMPDNKWLSEEAVRNYTATLSEDEKQIRIHGKPRTLSGVLYPNFKDAEPFVVPQVEIPWDVRKDRPWPVILGVDPHERKPLYCEWGYLTPQNEIVWFNYALVPSGPLNAIKERIREIESTHPAPTVMVVMDPNRGKAIQLGGSSWCETFEEWGYDVLLGIDDANFGRGRVREMLAYSDGQIPAMRWMEACRGKGGPIYQMLRHSWEDWARGSRFAKGVREKEKELNKDFPDIHRYVAAAKLDYKLLTGADSGMLRLGGNLSGPQENPYVKGASHSVRSPEPQRENGFNKRRLPDYADPDADAGAVLERFSRTDAARSYRNTRGRW